MFGGTFDPPHVGHVAALLAAHEQLGLERIYVVVANDPWQKSGAANPGASITAAKPGASITAARHRLAMCQAAFASLGAAFVISDIEIVRGGPSHTIDTVLELQQASRLAECGQPVLIVGADAAAGLDSWHRADELRSLVTVAVVQRSAPELPTAAALGTAQVPPGWEARPVTIGPANIARGSIALANIAPGQMPDIAAVSSSAIRQLIASGSVPDSRLPGSGLPDSRLPDSGLPDSRLPDSGLPDSRLPAFQLAGLAPAVLDYITAHGLYLPGLYRS